MEILSYVLDGQLEHKDNLGNGSVIVPGDVQRMSAGRGVLHSEFNPSRTAPVHFLQIWILPARNGIDPGYEQVTVPEAEKRGQLRKIATSEGGNGAVTIHQDASVYAALLDGTESVRHALAAGRRAYVHVARGSVQRERDTARGRRRGETRTRARRHCRPRGGGRSAAVRPALTEEAMNATKDFVALIGRVLLAVMFVYSGYGKIGGFEGTAHAIASKGLPLPEVGAAIALTVELIGGLMLVIGWKARWAAAAIVLFTARRDVLTSTISGTWPTRRRARTRSCS